MTPPKAKTMPTSLRELRKMRDMYEKLATITQETIDDLKQKRYDSLPPKGTVAKFVKFANEEHPDGFLYAAVNCGKDMWYTTSQRKFNSVKEKGYMTWEELVNFISYDEVWVVDDESCWTKL